MRLDCPDEVLINGQIEAGYDRYGGMIRLRSRGPSALLDRTITALLHVLPMI